MPPACRCPGRQGLESPLGTGMVPPWRGRRASRPRWCSCVDCCDSLSPYHVRVRAWPCRTSLLPPPEGELIQGQFGHCLLQAGFLLLQGLKLLGLANCSPPAHAPAVERLLADAMSSGCLDHRFTHEKSRFRFEQRSDYQFWGLSFPPSLPSSMTQGPNYLWLSFRWAGAAALRNRTNPHRFTTEHVGHGTEHHTISF